MRHISFALTVAQVRDRTKTVTRRLGWYDLEPGTLLQPVEKAQGLRKGERVRKIGGPIRVVDVRVEPLAALLYDRRNRGDCRREGFPRMRRTEFVGMFMAHNRCDENARVARIEFTYVEGADAVL